MSEILMKIVGLAGVNVATEHDGRFLVDYDPTRLLDGDVVHLVTTDDPAEGKRYHCLAALREDWARSIGTRSDGKPDRPLTAFTIEIVQAPERDPDEIAFESMSEIEKAREEQNWYPPARE